MIVSTEKGQCALVQLLGGRFAAARVVTAASGNQARRFMLKQDFDLVIINAPLPDETGQELAMSAAHQSSAGVLLLVRGDAVGSLQPNLADYGIIMLEKPLNRLAVEQAVTLMQLSARRNAKLQEENRRLEKKLDELRLVSRAKCLLISEQKMSEAEAHAYIERLAMDRRETKQAVAQNIIEYYMTE